MAKSRTKTIYSCQKCGAQRPRWEGRCSECGSWNSFVEETFTEAKHVAQGPLFKGIESHKPVALDREVEAAQTPRTSTNIQELDRVLGGGLVQGSFLLVGGDPGIGKSTLLLQMSWGVSKSDKRTLYVSAEESVAQTVSRAHRLGLKSPLVHIGSESNLETILALAKDSKPDVLVVDSIQTVFLPTVESAPGSVSQVRECAAQLMMLAKGLGITVLVIGHVTKDGSLAGPRVLEHMVDTVLSFEGDGNHQYRLLRSLKNRFGPANELGVFQMSAGGLKEISNPSEIFLEERSRDAVGSAIFASMEGSRPLLCEVQALTTRSYLPSPRRTSVGFDIQRVHLLCAVLDRHAGTDLAHADVFVNVVGGLRLDEPAADLGIAAALISSETNQELDPNTVWFGEIGLTGEIRAVTFVENRIKEALYLGFSRFVLPASNKKQLETLDKAVLQKIRWLKHVRELSGALSKPRGERTSTPLTI